MNLEDKKIEIDSVSSSGAEISVLRQNDGTINYQTLFVSPKSEDTQTNEEKSWIAGIKNLSLKDYKINFTDEAPATPVSASFSSISLDMKNLGNAKGSKSDISLKAKVNETGSIKVNGTAGIDPYTADLALSVSDVALKPFQSYADYFSKIDITGGSAGLQGKLGYDAAASDKPKMLYRGNFRIDDFHSNDRAQFNDLLKCKSLVLGDMEIDLLPGRLHIADISLTGPYAKVVIFKDGTTNLSKVFGKEDGADAPAQDNKKEEKGDKFPVAIDSISVKEGSMNFADLSLEPSFATGIHNLMGSIKGLSSDPLARANVSLTGAVDKYAPVRIEGKINPLAPKKFVDIALSFKNIEMTTLTPYSGKYAGYPIEKGKMSVDLDYKLDGSKLVGKNKIFLNQLILGDKVESPSATSLPVSLAIALLRDRDGNIDIDLPVTGDIDDPDFSYGQLVLKALVSLITKIVTSPFALIGSLFGGGEELNQIEFEYGSSELTPEQTGKLDVIARALYERPALRLEIKGVADKTSDRSALAEKAVTRTLKKLKADELQAEKKEVSPSLDDIEISDEEYPVLLMKAYKILQETKETDEEKPEATPDTMKQALIDAVDITDMDLQQLALNRAQQIKGYLLEAGKIENERVFILDAQITDTPESEKPFVMLSLL